MLPIAVQLYSVRGEAQKDFYGTLKKVKEMGYDGVEFAGLYGNSPEKVRQMCEELSLVPISAHVSLEELTADTEATVAAYREIGCKFIAIPYMLEEKRPGHELYEQTVEDIKAIAARCNANGIELLYHNHDFEFEKVDGEYALDMLYSDVPAELLKTQLDTCWVNVGGEDPKAYLLKYKGRAPVVHIKDFVMKGRGGGKLYDLIGIESDEAEEADDDFSYKPVGYGVQDIPGIIKASEEAGAKWLIVEIDEPDKGNTPLNAIKMSIDYLKTL